MKNPVSTSRPKDFTPRRPGSRRAGARRVRPRWDCLESRMLLANPAISILDATVQEAANAGPTVLAGAISPATAIVGYRIDGTAGERLQFHADAFSSTAGTWQLYGPDNRYLGGTSFGNDFQATLPAAGYYDLLLEGANSNPQGPPITYQVEVSNISDPPVNPSGLNAPQSGTFGPTGSETYKFTASEGQSIYLDVQTSTSAFGSYTLVGPSNQSIFSTGSGDNGPVTLPASGQYTLSVNGTQGVAYAFDVLALPAASTPLSLDTDTAGTLGPYQAAVYSFLGTPGESLTYLYELATSDGVNVTLYAPDNTQVFNSGNGVGSFVSPTTLTQPGRYYLVFNNTGATAENYQFQLGGVTGQVVSGQAVTGTLTSARSGELYSFAGAAGQQLYVHTTGDTPTGSVGYSVFAPDGSQPIYFTSDDTNSDRQVTLTETGTYLLWVYGQAAGATNPTYGLNLSLSTTPTDTLALDTLTSGTLAVPGAEHVYTFTGTPGEQLFYDGRGSAANIYTEITDPQGSDLFNTTASSDSTSGLVLKLPGTYTLTVYGAQNQDVTGGYSFDVRSVPGATAINPGAAGGAAISATLATGLTADVYSFTGVAGQQLGILPTADGNTYGAYYQVFGPNGAVVLQSYNDPGYGQSLTLPYSGTYLVAIEGRNAANANDPYALTVALTTTPTTTLALDTSASGTLAPGAEHVYTFAGTAGHEIYFDGQSPNTNFTAYLYDPYGNGAGFYNDNTAYDSSPYSLPYTGTYRLVIQTNGNATATSPYGFQLFDFSAGLPSLTLGAPITGTLTPGIADAAYTFAGTAGNQFAVQGLLDSHSSASYYRLYGPTGQYLSGSATDAGDNYVYSLSQTGSYTLLVAGQDTTDPNVVYSLRADESTPTTAALALNTPTSGTLAPAGAERVYTFNETAGHDLYFNGLTPASGIYEVITGPGGTNISYEGNAGSDYGVYVLTQTGAYTLTISGGGNGSGGTATGPYAFDLLDFNTGGTPITPTAVGGAAISATLATGASIDLYSFTGTAGDRLAVTGTGDGHSGGAYYYLYRLDANGSSLLSSSTDSGTNATTLPATGTYVLAVVGQSAANPTDPYGLTVVETTAPTAALALNAPVTGTITASGQQKVYTFHGTAGEGIFFDGLPSAPGIYASLYDPAGSNVYIGNGATTGDYGPFILAQTGTYTLTIAAGYPYGATGSYSFSVRDLATGSTPITPTAVGGATVSGTLATGLTTNIYSFTGTAGDRISIQGLGDQVQNGAYYYLYRPDLQTYVLSGAPDSTSNYNATTLPQSGTYDLLVEGADTSKPAQADAFGLQVIETTIPTSPLVLNATVTGTIALPGAEHQYTFTGTAGQTLIFDGLSAASGLYGTLDDPYGNAVGLSYTALSGDSNPFTLSRTGTYSLTVFGSPASATGAYDFELLDASTHKLSLPANGIAGTLSPGTQAAAYEFSGTAGEAIALSGAFTAPSGGSPTGTWYIYDPSDNDIAGTSFGNSLTPTLATDGTYTLVLFGSNAGGPTTYSFNLSGTTPAAVTPTGLNTPVTGTLAANASTTYTFTATAGQAIDFDNRTAGAISYYLYDPSRRYVDSAGSPSDFGPLVLTSSGTFTLSLSNNVGSASSYSFDLLSLPAAATTLTLGAQTGGTLAPYTEAIYQFHGTAGQTVFYDAQSSNSQVAAYLYSPTLTNIDSTNSVNDAGPWTLPATGTYELIEASNDSSARDYQFRLIDPSADPITINAPVTATLNPGLATDVYSFTGVAGQQLGILPISESASDGAYFTLDGPNGSNLANGYVESNYPRNVTLPYTGTYVLAVAGQSALNATDVYQIEVAVTTTPTDALTLGTPVTGTIALPGAEHAYTFTGTAGDSIFFDGRGPNSNLTEYLYDPDGNQVSPSGTNTSNDAGPYRLTASGIYRLVIEPYAYYSAATGPYNFDLHDIATATSLTLNAPITGTLASGLADDVYTFTGAAGQDLFIQDLADQNQYEAYYTLYGPNNQYLTASYTDPNYGGTFVKLPATGSYTLVVAGQSATVALNTYSLGAYLSTPTAATLTANTPVTGTIGQPGAQVTYSFSGIAGHQYEFDGQGPAGSNLRESIYDPFGNYVSNGGVVTSDYGPYPFTTTGTYTLVVSAPSTADTGPYAFNLLDLTAPPSTLALNTPLTATLATGATDAAYSFTGTAGHTLFIEGLGATPTTGAYYYLYGPQGQNLTSGYTYSGYNQYATLTQTGTYTLLVQGQNIANPDAVFSLAVYDQAPSSTTLALNATTNGSLTQPGQKNVYTFTATAGDALYYDGLPGSSSSLYETITGPGGTNISNGGEADLDYGPYVVAQSGTYTLTISGDGDTAIGSYAFKLHDFQTGSTPIDPSVAGGAAVTGTLATGTSVDFYSFTGTAGQQFYFQGVADAHANGALVYLYSPDYQTITDAYADPNSTFSATLPKAGTYYLLVVGRNSGNANDAYGSQVYQSTTPTATLALDTPVTGTIAAPNAQQVYTFHGAAGESLVFDAQGGPQYLYASLTDPFGGTIPGGLNGNQFPNSDTNPFILPYTGTYTLTVASYYGTTGPYQFELHSSPAATPLTLNAPITGTLAGGISDNVYTFGGASGQSLYIQGLADSHSNGAYYEVFDPNGRNLGGTYTENNRSYTLAATGAYTLVVYGQNSANATDSYGLTVNESTPTTATLALNTSTTGTIALTSQSQVYTFTGTPGQRLSFDGQSAPNSSFYAALYGPNGSEITNYNLASDGVLSPALRYPGTYTLVVASSDTSTGAYSFQLIDGATLPEASIGTTEADVQVTLSAPSSVPVTVEYTTQDGTATAPGDYQATSGILTFAPGQTTATIPVQIVDNPAPMIESNKTFTVDLSDPGNATISRGQATVTIVEGPQVTISGTTVTAPSSGTATATFVVSLSTTSPNDVTVHYATQDGTATAPGDYTATGGTLTIPHGQTSGTIHVTVNGSNQGGPDKTFSVALTGPTYSQLGAASSATGTIHYPAATGSVSGLVFDDLNDNGTQDPGEPGLAGWTVALYNGGTFVASANTDSDGNYAINNVAPGTYTLAEQLQGGYTETYPTAPGTYQNVTIKAGGALTGFDFGDILPALESIAVTPANPAVAKGLTEQFTATGTYSDHSERNVTGQVAWTSSHTAVATITGGGLASALDTGTTTIAAALGGFTGSTTLTVSPAALVSIAVTPMNPTIVKGATEQFTATGTLTDGTTEDLSTQVTWTSTAPAVATVSATGLAKSLAAGSTSILAQSGGITGSTVLTVGAAQLVSLAVTPANPAVAKGLTEQFTATGTYTDGTTADLTSQVTWASAHAAVATISASGLARALAAGTSSISAVDGGVTGSTVLTVGAAQLVSLAVTPADPTVPKGQAEQFTATGTYTDGTTADLTSQVTWASANTAVATITAGGLASALAAGSSTIDATDGGVTGATTLTVSPAQLVSLAVTPANPSVAKGLTEQFTATGTYTDGTTADLTSQVTWASANTAVATISASGLARALAAGTSSISAVDGGVTGSTVLTVGAAQLVSLAVTPADPTVPKGQAEQFTATGTYTDGTTASLTAQVTWVSTNTSVATITGTGLASAVATGSTAIGAKLGGVTGSTTLIVSAARLVSVAVTPADPAVAKGLAEQFTATGTLSDGTTEDLTGQSTWTSSATAVATISAGGLAQALASGATTIKAAFDGVTGSTVLTVGAAQLVSLAVTPANPSVAKGLTEQFTATGTYTDGTTADLTSQVTWASAHTAVATISASGLAQALAAGTSSISAVDGGVTGSTVLTVGAAQLVSLAVTPANPAVAKGLTEQFTATGTYTDGTTADLTSQVTWASAHTAVATITAGGLASALAAGTSSISAVDGGVTGSTTLTVAPAALVSIAVTPVNSSELKGQVEQFTATGTYTDGTTADLTSQVTWTSTLTAVATISASGLEAGVGAGSSIIAAKLGAIANSTSVTVSLPALNPAAVKDNAQGGYTEYGVWTTGSGGFNGTYRSTAATTAATSVRWVLQAPAGTYDLYATWPASAANTADASYAVAQGFKRLGTAQANQQVTPADGTYAGLTWAKLGTFTITGGTLTVALTASGPGLTVADGMILVPAAATFSRAATAATPPAIVSAVVLPPPAGVQGLTGASTTTPAAVPASVVATVIDAVPGVVNQAVDSDREALIDDLARGRTAGH